MTFNVSENAVFFVFLCYKLQFVIFFSFLFFFFFGKKLNISLIFTDCQTLSISA